MRERVQPAPPPRRRGRAGGWFRTVAALGMAALYAALIFARLWPADFRSVSWTHAAVSLLAFYIDTFAFQGGVALLLLTIVLVVIRRWRLALAAVPAVLFTVGPSLLRYWPSAPPAIPGLTLKVMSVNLLAFNPGTGGIAAEIAEADADLILIQEYNDRWHDAIQAAVGARYPHVFTVSRTDCFGLAIYSKLPFEAPVNPDLRLGGVNLPAIRAVVRLEGQSVVVFNIHLVPPYGVGQFQLQSRQVADLIERMAAEPGPVIAAGDFNLTAESRFAQALTRVGLVDSHDLGGRGRGSTWPVNNFLSYVTGIRIDHIFLGGGLTCASSRAGTGEGSDHRPVVAVVGLER